MTEQQPAQGSQQAQGTVSPVAAFAQCLPKPFSTEELTRWLFAHPDYVQLVAAAMEWMTNRRKALEPYAPRLIREITEGDLSFKPKQIGMPGKVADLLSYQRIFKALGNGDYVVAQFAEMDKAFWAYIADVRRAETEARVARPDETVMPAGTPADLFDGIVGYPEVKRAMAMLIGARRPIPALLVGEPASGKTLFLEALNRLPGAIYRSADGMTAPGIRQVIINTHPSIVVLDEIDKCADVHALAPLNELLESQTVSVMKYGESLRTDTHTRVFAACNYIERIPKEIISKFHVLRLKKYTPEEALHVSLTYLRKLGAPDDIARIIAHGVASRSRDIRDVRRAWDVCKTVQDAQWWVGQLGTEQKV